MISKIAGRVRGAFAINSTENREDEQFVMNTRGDLVVAQSLPPLAEIVRLGNTWQVSLATGLAALTALPTTTAGLSLYNGEAAGGAGTQKCYVIDAFGSVEEVVDATQTDSVAIFACNAVTPLSIATPAATALTIRGTSGNVYGGKARATTTLTITNDGWFGHAALAPLAPVAAGANWKVNECKVDGLYIVKPGGLFSVQSVKAAAAAAAQQFFWIRWHEVDLLVR